MNEASAAGRTVLFSLLLTALFTAALLFFGLRYAKSEPLVFLAVAQILTVSAVITGKPLKKQQKQRRILDLWYIPAAQPAHGGI